MKKLKCLFMGTPDFAVATLETLHSHPLVDLCLVVSMPDRPAGRGQALQSPAVIEYCKLHKIPYHQTENINKDELLTSLAKSLDLDFILVLAFAQFLNKGWLKMAKLGCFNIHTSLLPKYRGAAPIQYALLNGDQQTGVTIQEMVSKMDAGDVVFQSTTPILAQETGGSLTTKLKFLAATSCHDFLASLYQKNLERHPQDESQVSFAPTLSREMGKLDFSTQSAEQIECLVRALHPWPGTFCFMNYKRLKVFEVELSKEKIEAGNCVVTGSNEFVVGTTTSALRLSSFQLEGKKRTTDRDFFKTLQDKKNFKLS